MKTPALVFTAAVTLFSHVALGSFVLFDDFSAYTNAPLVGQGPLGNTWQRTGGDTNIFVATNYSGANLAWCLSAPGNSGAWRSLAPAALAITNGSPAATVFMEFAYFNPIPGSSPAYNQWNFIVTDRLPTDTAGSSEIQLNWDSTQFSPGGGVSTFRIRNGGSFVFASTTGTAAGDVPVGTQYIATTYKVWFLINKSNSTYQVYMQNDAIPSLSGSPQQIFADNGAGGNFGFRNGASILDLTNINLGCTPTGQAGAVVYDNIYVDVSGYNLSSPAGNIPIQPPAQTPPTVSLSNKKTTGLNIITGSAGNTYYDRQQVRLTNTVGKAWVGHATAGNSVKYTYTIKSFDSASYGAPPTFAAEYAYLYLIPNGGVANTPDYNSAAGCQIFVMKESPTNAILQFQYKVDLANGNDMYYGRGLYTNAPGSWDGLTSPWYESGQLGGVTNFATSDPAVGTWTIEFTSDTNVTLIAPNGNTASYVIPPYNIAPFSADDNFGIYMGNMAQNQQGLNQNIVYSSFSVTGVPIPFTDNFTNDNVLSPQWDSTTSSDPSCVFVLPSSAAYVATWPTANGGHWLLQGGASLLQMTNWNSLSTYPQIAEIGRVQQYIDQTELPGPVGFYNLKEIKFTQLQVLLPGETNAPGTLTGKVGSPTPVSLGAGGFINVTVNAVDSSFNIIPGVSDIIELTSDDAFSILPNNAGLVNGSVTFGVTGATQPLAFGSEGTWTITASDVSVFSTNIPEAASSPVSVGP